ncbi:hypothetical protein [Segnochrobactrum spirostomi]|uniref:Uncharacterized protein n=1 Tax=Segnochrobactrum spirostomi TaxID=2608987 RepID=A0A6A7XZW7_9HYPH|nr:hypothetical protein [Segnochrobactrum spirostomi]MQT11886.1 hypothetical protein [Segnochrobactrum spirostomi]
MRGFASGAPDRSSAVVEVTVGEPRRLGAEISRLRRVLPRVTQFKVDHKILHNEIQNLAAEIRNQIAMNRIFGDLRVPFVGMNGCAKPFHS